METDEKVQKLSYKDFDNKKVLGEGFFNQVYFAKHQELGPCVLKIVARAFYVKEKQRKKLEDEAAYMFSLKHDNILKGYGIVMEQEHLCLVYEYAYFGCLSDALRRIPIPWQMKLNAAYQICLALEFLHELPEPVIHRNLKSTNVLFTKEFNVKISDFMLSKAAAWVSHATQEKDKTNRKKMAEGQCPGRKGTALAHIPPEIMKNINIKAVKSYDVYSFGVILWEMLCEKRPFEGCSSEEVYRKMADGFEHPRDAVKSGCPKPLLELMVWTLNKNPGERPTFKESSMKLQPFIEDNNKSLSKHVKVCQNQYEEYKKSKRKKGAQTQTVPRPTVTGTSRLPSRSNSNPPDTGLTVSTTEHQFSKKVEHTEDSIPTTQNQAVESSNDTKMIPASSQSRSNPVENEDPFEEEDPNLKKEPEVIERSESYMETGEDQGNDKTTPFFEGPGNMSVQRGPNVTNYYINSNSVDLQVIENQIQARPDNPPSTPPPTPPTPNIPARGSQRLLTKRDEYKLLENVGNRWRFYARALGFSDGQIDIINHDYDREGLQEKIYQVTYKWKLKQGGRATIGALVESLIEGNLSELASLLDP